MIRLRSASASDAAPLTALMLANLAYEGRYRKIIEGYPVTRELIACGITRVAEDEGALAGFYRLDTDTAELDLMFIADDRQRSGTGRLIFDDMIFQAKFAGLSSVRIVAHPPAAGFYRRMGARDTGLAQPSGRIDWERPEFKFDLR